MSQEALAPPSSAGIGQGLYQIFNAQSNENQLVQAGYEIGTPVTLDSPAEPPVLSQLWIARPVRSAQPELYTLQSLNGEFPLFAVNPDEDPNHWIYSSTNNNAYYINSDDNKNYVIRTVEGSKVWAADDITGRHIRLQDPDGSKKQLWQFKLIFKQ